MNFLAYCLKVIFFVYRCKEVQLNFLHVCLNQSSISLNVQNVSRAGQAMACDILKSSAMHSTMKAYFVNTPLNYFIELEGKLFLLNTSMCEKM